MFKKTALFSHDGFPYGYGSYMAYVGKTVKKWKMKKIDFFSTAWLVKMYIPYPIKP